MRIARPLLITLSSLTLMLAAPACGDSVDTGTGTGDGTGTGTGDGTGTGTGDVTDLTDKVSAICDAYCTFMTETCPSDLDWPHDTSMTACMDFCSSDAEGSIRSYADQGEACLDWMVASVECQAALTCEEHAVYTDGNQDDQGNMMYCVEYESDGPCSMDDSPDDTEPMTTEEKVAYYCAAHCEFEVNTCPDMSTDAMPVTVDECVAQCGGDGLLGSAAAISDACLEDSIDFLLCLELLTCEEFDDYWNGIGDHCIDWELGGSTICEAASN